MRCRRILRYRELFVPESKELAFDFFDQHKGNVSDGAFVIAVFSIQIENERIQMVAMLKIDNQRVLQYSVRSENGEKVADISEILNSFVESKAALQKCAVVDVSDSFDWEVLAHERRKTSGIADYFRLFLNITELETASNLTRMAIGTVGRWSQLLASELPESGRAYRTRAINYMDSADSFDTDTFVDLVVKDEDPERKASLVSSLREQLVERGVAGQQFAPHPNSIDDRDRRNKIKTEEGVSIVWQGSPDAVGLSLPAPDAAGVSVITLRTQGWNEG